MVEININVRRFLVMLAWSEGTDNGRQKTRNLGWRVMGGILVLRSFCFVTLNPKLKSTGAGRYQLLSRWWDATTASSLA